MMWQVWVMMQLAIDSEILFAVDSADPFVLAIEFYAFKVRLKKGKNYVGNNLEEN